MKPSLYFLLVLIASILPVYAIYWLLLREYLLAVTRARLLRLFVDVRVFSLHQPDGHPAWMEAARGQIACASLEKQMDRLDMGDLIAGSMEPASALQDFTVLDPAISDEDAAQIRSLHARFRQIFMAFVLINSPLWFPVVAMVDYGSQWSAFARWWSDRIKRGLEALIVAQTAPETSPTWT